MNCSLCGAVLPGTFRAAWERGWRVVMVGAPRNCTRRVYCPTHHSDELLRDVEPVDGEWVLVGPKPDRRARARSPAAPLGRAGAAS